eukprot:g3600.t1
MAAIPPAVQAVLDQFQPLNDQWNNQRAINELQGQGWASEAQRNHVNATNDELDEPCSDRQYLIVSRSIDNRDIKRTWSARAFTEVDWKPFAFIAALFAAGALVANEARQMQKFVKNAITGSVTSNERPGMDRDLVFKIFWETIAKIFSSEYLPMLVARAADPAAVPPVAAETPAELYTRRLRNAMTSNFFITFDQKLDWQRREASLRADTDARIARADADRLRDKNDMKNTTTQLKNQNQKFKITGGGGTTTGAGATVNPPGGKGKGKGERPSVLDAYVDPLNPNRERSPYRANPKEKMVCRHYARGNPDAPCKDVAKGEICNAPGGGRHGGSFRRVQYLNVKESMGLSHEQVRAKCTE